MATQWIWAVALQHDRIAKPRLQDEEFHPFRVDSFHEADVHFLAIALSRLRRIATTIEHVPLVMDEIRAAIQRFEDRMPWLKQLRDVFEHLEDYAVDSNRRRTAVSRRYLQVWSGTENGMNWMGHEINFKAAIDAGSELYKAVQNAYDLFMSTSR